MKDLYKDKLEILSVDSYTLQALESLFKDQIDKIKPEVQDGDDNSLIGEKYRSYTVARGVLEGVLKDIKSYNTKTNSNKSFNKGK